MNTARCCWVALLAVLGLAGSSPATVLTFRNEVPTPVIVQTVTAIGVVTRRDKPTLLPPGGIVNLPFDGDKIVTIYDPRSNRVLFRNALKQVPAPLAFGIIVDPRLPGAVTTVPRPLLIKPMP